MVQVKQIYHQNVRVSLADYADEATRKAIETTITGTIMKDCDIINQQWLHYMGETNARFVVAYKLRDANG